MSSSPRPSAEQLEELFRKVSLADAGFEVSDGVRFVRCSVDEAARRCLWGEIYEIRQTVHVFCVDFLTSGPGVEWTWTLHFEPARRAGDVRELTARELRNAVHLFAEPQEAEWRASRAGRWSRATGFVNVPS